MSDSEVIRRILSGEDALFAQVVARYSGYVWAVCASYVRNRSDCEDVAQEVFVQCYRRLDTLRNPAALGAWLGQLARRQCLMWLRAAKRRESREIRFEGERTAAPHPAREELQESLAQAVDQLPPVYREALLLRYGEGFSVQQAAAFLGITPAAMRKRIERAQHMLKDALWDEVEPALSKRKHHEHLASAVMAAIPFWDAPWLHSCAASTGAIGTGGMTAGTNAAVFGGVLMAKKMVVGVVVIAAVLALVWTGARLRTKSDIPQPAPVPVDVATAQEDDAPSTEALTSVAALPETEAPVAPSPEPAPYVVTPASVSGLVTASNGEPISGAEVILDIARDGDRNDIAKTYRATTDAGGAYRIGGIDVFDDVVVYATADGYTMGFNHKVKIGEGVNLQDVDIMLEAAAYYVAGYVRTQGRQPIPDASVDTMYYGYDEEGLELTAATGRTTGNIGGIKLKFARTDNKGYFKIGLASDGLCDLRVVKEGYGPGFFPRIPAGTDDADLVLRADGAIGGRITTSDNKPMAGQRVVAKGEVLPGGLEPSEVRIQTLPATPASATTDQNGDYVIEGLGEDYRYTVVAVASADDSVDDLPTEQGLRTIAQMMKDFDEDIFKGGDVAAQKGDVHVKAGRTTRVDLEIGAPTSGVVFGKVTDRTSGRPVCPVAVTAAAEGAEGTGLRAMMDASHGGSAVTNFDGEYRLRVHSLAERVKLAISHAFMTEGGSAWEQPGEIAKVIDLGPGEEREVNLEIDAPVVVPVLYVNTDGSPREGILAAMRTAGGRGGCGGTLISGADGRVTFHGIRPGVALQAVAWVDQRNRLKTIGVSEPFTGEPGETMPEVTVVCRANGGIAGVITYPDGRPVAESYLFCGVIHLDGSMTPAEGAAGTDANGAFMMDQAFPEGIYPAISLGFLGGDPPMPYSVHVPDVEIVAEQLTDLGTLSVTVERDFARVATAAGYDRASNQVIASVYSAEQLPSVTDVGVLLKTGMALYDVGRYDDALAVFQQMTHSADPQTMYPAVGMVWQGQMLDLLGRRQEAVATYAAVAAMGVEGTMRHDQFGLAYNPSEYAQQRIQQPFARVENQAE